MQLDELYYELEECRRKIIIVEGPKDKRSLEKLGCTNVIHLQKPLFQTVEELQHHEEVLILTDLDEHGRKLYKYFYSELTKRGVRVNNKLRLLIFQTPIRHIEGLATYLANVEKNIERMELRAITV
jgi:5S rRNA maturation endonuclease (ribonuclease M5)